MCRKAEGPYIGPNVKKGSIIANNPMDLPCMNLATIDPSKDGKENVLVMTDAFSNFYSGNGYIQPTNKDSCQRPGR